MLSSTPQDSVWPVKCEISERHDLRATVGPLQLGIRRVLGEWHLWFVRSTSALQTARPFSLEQIEVNHDADACNSEPMRICVTGSDRQIRLGPRLADRNIVSHTLSGFHVGARQSARIFAESPLWIAASSVDPNVEFLDAPIVRPSDTWLGPSPARGELCYTSNTSCVLDLGQLTPRAHSAITTLTLMNSCHDRVEVLRLKIPALYLSLYQDHQHRIWTSDVLLERKIGQEFGEYVVGLGPPANAPESRLIGTPRLVPRGNLMSHAFGTLFRSSF